MMEEKFLHLNDQMSKFQTATNLLETELHKKDTIIEKMHIDIEQMRSTYDLRIDEMNIENKTL